MLIVTDHFDVSMLTKSCEIKLMSIDTEQASLLLSLVPPKVHTCSSSLTEYLCKTFYIKSKTLHFSVPNIKMAPDDIVMVIKINYNVQSMLEAKDIWLISFINQEGIIK